MLVGGGGGVVPSLNRKWPLFAVNSTLKPNIIQSFTFIGIYNGQVLLHIVLGITVSFNDTRQFELP